MSEMPGSEGTGSAPKLDSKLIFSVLNSRARRRLLVALSDGKARSAGDLKHLGKGDGWCDGPIQYLDSTIKNLKLMMEAGLVVELDDAGDGRRSLYALHPGIKPTAEDGKTVFNFGFVIPRIAPNGD